MRKILWVDVETGGTNYKTDAITQVAVMITHANGGIIYDHEWLIKPDPALKMVDRALAIQGLTREQIDLHEHSEKTVMECLQLLANCEINKPMILGGFRVGFDRSFILEAFRRASMYPPAVFRSSDFYDVSEEYKRRHCTMPSLETVCKQYGITNTEPHNALSDVRATVAVHKCIYTEKMGEVIITPRGEIMKVAPKKMTMEQWRKYKS